MLVKEALQADIDRQDIEILLAFGLRVPRTWIIAHPEHALSAEEDEIMNDLFARRKSGEPIAYIIKEKEFYGRPFVVDKSVLIPRPATEHLIDLTLNVLHGHTVPDIVEADEGIVIASHITERIADTKCIIDIGTGSGCIAITLASEMPTMRVVASDISAAALHIAQLNAEYLDAENVEFIEADGVDALKDIHEPFLIVSNPPYIPDDTKLMKDVMDFEPHTALFGGKDGTDLIEKLFAAARASDWCTGIIVECRKEQGERMCS